MAQQQSDYRFTFASAAGEFDVISFNVTEQLSTPYQLNIFLSRKNEDPVPFDKVLDNPGTLTFWKGDKVIRYLNGIISFFKQTEQGKRRTRYQATIVPAFSRTELYSNVRRFQLQTVPDIIRKILKGDGIDFIRFELEAEHVTREYCVQYRETDKAFIERIAAEEGIFYYFEHGKDIHTLVFSDAVHLLGSLGTVLHNPNTSASRTEPSLWGFSYQEQIAPAQHKMRDYSFKNPDYDLEHKSISNNAENQHKSYEKYDYPGRYKKDVAGKPFNQNRLEHERRESQLGNAHSDDLRLIAGKHISLSESPRANPLKDWLITRISHDARQSQSQEEDGSWGSGNHYGSNLTMIPFGKAWRAETTHKPRVDGEQIARVTGPKDEEIYCDEHGRVKIQFPWDLESQYDDLSSCWVRVSQGWAGVSWGSMAIPRIGQEVIVSFLEGDPDQPIITGRTYHAYNKPPFELPKHKTRMSIKSKTHKGDGFNELRFEDEAGKEQVFIHAQKDQDIRVLNDGREWMGNDRHLIVKNDQIEAVEGNKHSVIKKDRFEQIDGDQHFTAQGDQNDTITGSTSRNIGMELQEKIGNKHAVEAGTDIHLNAGMNVVLEAGSNITLKSGGSFISINPAGIFIQGANVNINSGGSPTAGAGSNPKQATPPRIATVADDATPGWKMEPPPPVKEIEALVIEEDAEVIRTERVFKDAGIIKEFGISHSITDRSWLQLKHELFFPDDKMQTIPAAGASYKVICANGSRYEGELDANGCASLKGVGHGNAQIYYEPEIDDEIKQLQEETKKALETLVKQELEEAKRIEKEYNESHWAVRRLKDVQAVGTGLWSFVTGIFGALWSILKGLGSVLNEVNQQVGEYVLDPLNAPETFKEDVKAIKEKYEALRQFADEDLETYFLFMQDKETWSIFEDFGKDYLDAQHYSEYISGGTEAVLGVILTVLTAGAGGVAAAGSAGSRLTAVANKLSPVIKKLVTLLKKRRNKRHHRDNTDQRIETQNKQEIGGGVKNVANFADESKLAGHFEKHGAEFGAKSSDEYLSIAQGVMKDGDKVEYIYKGETRTGYVQLMGTNRKGKAKFAFVGTNNQGHITTLHSKSGKDIWKTLNGSATDKTINPVQ